MPAQRKLGAILDVLTFKLIILVQLEVDDRLVVGTRHLSLAEEVGVISMQPS